MIKQEIKSIQFATLDELPLISNRQGFFTMVDHSLKVCRRNQISMSFIFFDLNKFKSINDEYGHHEGDFVLITFAQIMLSSFLDCDLIGRLGGDEFITMLSDADKGKAVLALERFTIAIDKANETLKKPYKIEYSASIRDFQHGTDRTIEEMIQDADAAMYQQKKNKVR
jgi:diguanylate cyclase (GGDEF)-like protein